MEIGRAEMRGDAALGPNATPGPNGMRGAYGNSGACRRRSYPATEIYKAIMKIYLNIYFYHIMMMQGI